jgi:hypothetical protein
MLDKRISFEYLSAVQSGIGLLLTLHVTWLKSPEESETQLYKTIREQTKNPYEVSLSSPWLFKGLPSQVHVSKPLMQTSLIMSLIIRLNFSF